MDKGETNTRKRVLVSQLKPGVDVVELDQSWLQSPLYIHRRKITDASEVELLKKSGIREVIIDTARGADVDSVPDPSPAAVSENPQAKRELSPANVPQRTSGPAATQPFAAFTQEFEIARSIHADSLRAAKNIFAGVGSGLPINSSDAQKIVTDLLMTVT